MSFLLLLPMVSFFAATGAVAQHRDFEGGMEHRPGTAGFGGRVPNLCNYFALDYSKQKFFWDLHAKAALDLFPVGKLTQLTGDSLKELETTLGELQVRLYHTLQMGPLDVVTIDEFVKLFYAAKTPAEFEQVKKDFDQAMDNAFRQ